MKEHEFEELVQKHLSVLEGRETNKNGKKSAHIIGVGELYKALFSNLCKCSSGKIKRPSFKEWLKMHNYAEVENEGYTAQGRTYTFEQVVKQYSDWITLHF
jgi:hypothetical protein